MAAEQSKVDDIQPEGSAGENQSSGEADLTGAGGESLPLGTGETLSGEDTGDASGEGEPSSTPGRNKYTAKLENLTYSAGILAKDLAAGKENFDEAIKEAKNIKQCIESILTDLEAEEKPTWREIK